MRELPNLRVLPDMSNLKSLGSERRCYLYVRAAQGLSFQSEEATLTVAFTIVRGVLPSTILSRVNVRVSVTVALFHYLGIQERAVRKVGAWFNLTSNHYLVC
jgi:hypothetical protein